MTAPAPPDLARIVEAARGDAALIPPLVGRLVDEHGAWNAGSLNLVASHNYLSPTARALLSSNLADHILSGAIGTRHHSGGAWIEAVDTLVVELCKRLFGARAVEYRPMSGALANGVALAALAKPGEDVVAIDSRHGGHRTYREGGYGGVLGYRLHDIPWDEGSGAIDLDRLDAAARKIRPKLIIVGTAELRFPYPVKELGAIAERVGARLFYDGAHVLGLIAGGAFQDPLRQGAHVLTGSTQKTLGGPIGGLIMATDDAAGAAIAARTSGLISNYHNNRIAALAVTLAEMVRFGRDYAAQVVANARALAAALDREGLPIPAKDGSFTDSHIVLVDATRLPDGESVFARLEAARILSTRVPLPHTYPKRQAIRLGTAAVTRLGMKEDAMATIARLVARVAAGEPPSAVAAAVGDLARSHRRVQYCF